MNKGWIAYFRCSEAHDPRTCRSVVDRQALTSIGLLTKHILEDGTLASAQSRTAGYIRAYESVAAGSTGSGRFRANRDGLTIPSRCARSVLQEAGIPAARIYAGGVAGCGILSSLRWVLARTLLRPN